MTRQAAQDRIGVAVGRAQSDADEIEVRGGHGPHGGSVVRVVARAEHLGRVDGQRDAAPLGPLAHRAQLGRARLEDQDGLDEQGEIPSPVAVEVVLADGLGAGPAVMPLMRNAVTLSRCQTARSSRTTIAALVSKSVTATPRHHRREAAGAAG